MERELTACDVTLRELKIDFCQWSVNLRVSDSRSVNCGEGAANILSGAV